jgi:hypothetical protein
MWMVSSTCSNKSIRAVSGEHVDGVRRACGWYQASMWMVSIRAVSGEHVDGVGVFDRIEVACE